MVDLIDIETAIKASRLAWIGRLFSEGSLPWKAYINQLLEDFEGKFLFRCNYDVKDYKTYSKFYNELLQCGLILGPLFQESLPSPKV